MGIIIKRDYDTLIKYGFILHFLNGGLAAIFYPLALNYIPILKDINANILGILFAILLWILTLAPIHKPITGVSIMRHPLGYKPALLSLIAHIVYGLVVVNLVGVIIYG